MEKELPLVRDKDFINSVIYEKDGTYYTKETCIIEFPAWYEGKGMAVFGDEVYFFGFCIILVGNKYAVSTIPTLCASNPINIKTIERHGEKFTQLEFGKDDPILATKQVIQETLMSYDFFNNFFVRSKVPWYVEYLDLVAVMNNLVRYAGSNVGVNPITNELIVSYITRDAKDPNIYYRQTNMSKEPTYVDLMDLYYGVKSTINKLSGGYFQEGLVSALTSESETMTQLEMHLKG